MSRQSVRAHAQAGRSSLEVATATQFNKLLTEIATNLKYRATAAAGLAIGSVSKKTLKIVNTVTFIFNGSFGSKTTAAVAFTATTHDIAAAAGSVQEAVYLLCFSDISGTPAITMGAIATGAGTAVVPNTPTGKTAVAHARIAVAAGATPFDATSDDLDAAHLTVTYTDLAYNLPEVNAEQLSF